MIFNNSKYNQSWPIKELNELGEFRRGKSKHRPRNDERLFSNGTIPLVQTGEIKEANLYINKHNANYNEFGLRQSKLWKKNTLCITIAANIAETALLGYPMCFPDSVVGFNAYPEESSELFLHYVFTYIKRAIQSAASGSIQDNINIDFLTKLKFRIPLKDDRIRITKVLSDLDTKIELNNKINKELESMAKLIYDYWFVQFDFPNEEGKPYKSSGGKMVYNEELKREFPDGWEVKKVSTCCNIIDCLHSKKSDYLYEDEKYYLLQLENIKDDGLIDLTKKYFVSKDEYKRWSSRIEVKDHDLVITNAGRVAGLAQIPEGIVTGIGRNITAIRPIDICPTFLYYTFQGAEMERQIKLNTDTGSFFKSLNVRGIKELFVIRPPKYLEEKFEKIALPHRRMREQNSNQNQELSSLRDWLLPMLMNGQVKVDTKN